MKKNFNCKNEWKQVKTRCLANIFLRLIEKKKKNFEKKCCK
jgi:hypothetical protein